MESEWKREKEWKWKREKEWEWKREREWEWKKVRGWQWGRERGRRKDGVGRERVNVCYSCACVALHFIILDS